MFIVPGVVEKSQRVQRVWTLREPPCGSPRGPSPSPPLPAGPAGLAGIWGGQSGVVECVLGSAPLRFLSKPGPMRFGGQQALGSAGFALSCQSLEEAAESGLCLPRPGRSPTGVEVEGPVGSAVLRVWLLHRESLPVFTEVLPLLPAGAGGPGPGPEL